MAKRPLTDAQRKAVAKYNAKAYEEIKLRVPRGTKTDYQNLAAAKGTSLNNLINELLQQELTEAIKNGII